MNPFPTAPVLLVPLLPNTRADPRPCHLLPPLQCFSQALSDTPTCLHTLPDTTALLEVQLAEEGTAVRVHALVVPLSQLRPQPLSSLRPHTFQIFPLSDLEPAPTFLFLRLSEKLCLPAFPGPHPPPLCTPESVPTLPGPQEAWTRGGL